MDIHYSTYTYDSNLYVCDLHLYIHDLSTILQYFTYYIYAYNIDVHTELHLICPSLLSLSHLYIYLSVYLPTYLAIYLSICLFVCLLYLSIYLAIYQSIYLSFIDPSIQLVTYQI